MMMTRRERRGEKCRGGRRRRWKRDEAEEGGEEVEEGGEEAEVAHRILLLHMRIVFNLLRRGKPSNLRISLSERSMASNWSYEEESDRGGGGADGYPASAAHYNQQTRHRAS